MKFIIPVILAILLSSCVGTNRTIFLKPPLEGEGSNVDVAAYEAKYGKEDGVFLDFDESIEHSTSRRRGAYGEDSWTYEEILHRKYIVLNPDVEELTTFSLSTTKSAEIGVLYLRVTSPDGKTTEYGLKDLIKESTSKWGVQYKFIYPSIVKGSVIEEGYELGYDAYKQGAALQEEIPFQFDIPCERVSFTYAFPDWWELYVKDVGVEGGVPFAVKRDMENMKIVCTWTAVNVPAIKQEPFQPYFKQMSKYIEFMVSDFRMGALHLTTAKEWHELIVDHWRELTDREGNGLFTSRVEATTEELMKGKTAPIEKLTTILDYVQNTIEPAEDYENRDFADVLKDKKGDSYDVTGLTNMMMEKAGLNTNFILVHSEQEGHFDPKYYSFNQLSIPAIHATVEGNEYVLLPYRKDIPYDYIPDYLQGQTYVVVSDTSKAELRTIPTGTQTKNIVSERYELAIGTDGMITVKETNTIEGTYGYTLREVLATMKQSARDKFLKELISYSEGQVNITSFAVENEKEYKKPLVLRYSYTIDNLVTLTPDEVLFHTAGLLAPTSLKDFQVEAEDRESPIQIHYNEEYEKVIEIKYPEGWEIKTTLRPFEVENIYGSLKMEVEKGDHVVKVKQVSKLKKSSGPKQSVPMLARLTGSKANTNLPTIVFAKKP